MVVVPGVVGLVMMVGDLAWRSEVARWVSWREVSRYAFVEKLRWEAESVAG